ncbi:MAG: Rrf2 family transcriptional regulator [Acidobacteriales bacterium]|nr:Rrf2 family transcriptional regulator [Terriglobales bacterium]
MLKLTKKADYGLIALKHLAEVSQAEGMVAASSAKDIADAYHLPQEALAKILQKLVKAGLLVSQHGTNGGYALGREAKRISAFEVIRAIDGPMFFTSCSTHKGECQQSSKCNVKEPLAKVSESIQQVLMRISIADMMDPNGPKGAGEEPESKPQSLASNLVTLA